MANEIQQRQATEIDPRQHYKREVDKRVDLLKPLLGDITPEQAKALLYQAAAATPELLNCTPPSVIRAMAVCLQLGLMPGPKGHIYLIPRRINEVLECTIQAGYKGYLHLAFKSGVTVHAGVVYRQDDFRVEDGERLTVHHIPNIDHDAKDDDLIASYAFATLPGGAVVGEWMRRSELIAIKRRAASKTGPWTTDFSRQCRKSAIRRLFQGGTVPMSDEMARLIEVEQEDEQAPALTTGRAPSTLEIAAGLVPPPTEIDPLTQFRSELADCPDRDAVYTCRDGWQMDHEQGPLWPDMLAAVQERLTAL